MHITVIRHKETNIGFIQVITATNAIGGSNSYLQGYECFSGGRTVLIDSILFSSELAALKAFDRK